jgi:hypothetical protein
VHNAVDGTEVLLVLCFFEVVRLQSVEEESDCCVFVLCRMDGSPPSQTLSSLTLPTILHNTNMQQSDSCSTD